MPQSAAPVSPLRILHVIYGLNQGGAEHSLSQLVQGTAGRLEHAVVCFGPLGDVGERMQALGVTLFHMPLTPTGLYAARQAVQGFEPHLVQGWMYYGNVLAALIRRSRPLAFNVRTAFSTPDSLPTRQRAALDFSRFARPDLVLFNAQAGQQCHAAWVRNGTRQRVIPNGVDSEVFKPAPHIRTAVREELGVGDKPLVGLVSRYHADKGVDVYLRVARALQSEAMFCLAGRGMAEACAERSDIDGLIVRDQVVTPGFLPALDVLVVASRREGTPNILLEAMACGVAVVGTDCGDVADIIDDPTRVCAVDDDAALAQSVARTLTDAATIGQRDRQRVMSKYDTRRCFDAYVESYLETTRTSEK